MRRLAAFAIALGAFFSTFLSATDASAYSWMIRHGYAACRTCHTDPTGGETLNSFGRLQADQVLMMRWGSDASPGKSRGFLWGLAETPPELALGGSYRHMTLFRPVDGDVRSFPMQIDAYGHFALGKLKLAGSLGAAKVPEGSPHARPAFITSNEGGLNLISRNHWAGYELGPEMLVRAGRINLPFGVRIVEHVMWVREATRTDRESDQQHGVAFAYTGTDVRFEIMGIAGNFQVSPDRYRERGYAASAEYLLLPKLGVGISSELTVAEADRLTLEQESVTRHAHGALARWSPAKPLVLLFEADALLQSRKKNGYVGFLQADLEPVQGLHFIATGEVLDAGLPDASGVPAPAKSPGLGEPGLGGWLGVGWFFLPHLDMRVDAVLRQGDSVLIQSQIHAYL